MGPAFSALAARFLGAAPASADSKQDRRSPRTPHETPCLLWGETHSTDAHGSDKRHKITGAPTIRWVRTSGGSNNYNDRRHGFATLADPPNNAEQLFRELGFCPDSTRTGRFGPKFGLCRR